MIEKTRERLHKQLDKLPDEIVEQIADFTLFVMARHQISANYSEWGRHQWRDFALEQLFGEDDDVSYSLKEAQEVYRP